MGTYQISYQIVTPESAQNGDTAENGFLFYGNHEVPIDEIDFDRDSEYFKIELNNYEDAKDCLTALESYGIHASNDDFSSIDTPTDTDNLTQGHERYYSAHFSDVRPGILRFLTRNLS